MAKEKLVEIKKGQVGTGLLIENDGYVSLDIKDNRKLVESTLSGEGDTMELPRPFIVNAIFQKYGVENANGRIYPEDILKREVEKYKRAIAERRAIGECYTPDVLILTERHGWVRLGDVKEGETILTLNPETKRIEIKPILRKISYDYDGDMIRLKGNSIDDLVTPDHKYPLFNRNHKFKDFYSANDLYSSSTQDISHFYIPKTGEWCEIGDEYITLKGIENPTRNQLRWNPDCKDDLRLKIEPFMKFMGIYLSEGCVNSQKNSSQIFIYQVKKSVCDLIDEMLIELGLPYKKYKYETDGKTVFKILDARLHDYLLPLGKCYTKYIPYELKKQSKENLRLLYDWFVLGDGRIRGDKKFKVNKNLSDDAFSTSKQLVMDINEIQLKIGYNGTYHTEKRDNDRYVENRLIEGRNCQPMHFTYRSLTKGVYTDKRFIKIYKEYYKGKVECVEVENHTWFVMSNGKTHWTGNCNHPDSGTIDLERVSMNIVELHWEGRTLVGKLEIPITEGYRKYGMITCLADHIAHLILSGIRIGVSSRALGTVKQIGGVLMVNDDLELICWDFVSTPSTPGAYVSANEGELDQFKEEKKNDDSKLINEDKFSKFDAWLLK